MLAPTKPLGEGGTLNLIEGFETASKPSYGGRMLIDPRIRMLSICTALVLFLLGCASVDSSWKTAKQVNTIESYETFLKNYPDSEYAVRAKMLIETLYWKKARRINTVQAYENFLTLQPRAKIFPGDALERIIRLNALFSSIEEELLQK